jgi:hypothetical protein
MRKLLTFLIALAAIVFAIASPVSAQIGGLGFPGPFIGGPFRGGSSPLGRVSGQVVAVVPANSPMSTQAFPLPNPVTSGNALVGVVEWDSSSVASITSIVDDKGASYSHSTAIKDTTNNQSAELFWLGNITSGAKTVTVTFAGSTQFTGGIMREYSGVVASSNPSDGQTGQVQLVADSGTDLVTSTAVTTTQSGDGIVGYTISTDETAGTISAGTGFSVDQSTANQFASEDLTQATAASVAATFSITPVAGMITFILALKTH